MIGAQIERRDGKAVLDGALEVLADKGHEPRPNGSEVALAARLEPSAGDCRVRLDTNVSAAKG